jgi:hypothetical protein
VKASQKTVFFNPIWTQFLCEEGAEENIWPKERRSDGMWKELHNQEVRKLFPSICILGIIKSRIG